MSTWGIGGGLHCSDPPEESCSDADCPLHNELTEAEVWRDAYGQFEAAGFEPEVPRYEITHDGVTTEAVVVQDGDKTIVQPAAPLAVRSGESFTITGGEET